MNLVVSFAYAGAFAGFWLASCCGCDLPGKPNPADRPIAPHDVSSFDTLFGKHCAGCHGAEGKLGPAPPLNDPLFLAVIPDEEWVRVLHNGRRGTPMPAFALTQSGPLTDAQLQIIIQGISDRWQLGVPKDPELPNYAAKLGDASRGEAIFLSACANCHGAEGKGPAESELPNAINDAAFLTLISDQALRRIIITGRPDLGMPNYAEKAGRADDFQPLSNDNIADLTALLASWRTAKPAEVSAAQNP